MARTFRLRDSVPCTQDLIDQGIRPGDYVIWRRHGYKVVDRSGSFPDDPFWILVPVDVIPAGLTVKLPNEVVGRIERCTTLT